MSGEDWQVMREEAVILVELLRSMSPSDPDIPAVIERAQELQRLGLEARELAEATARAVRH